VSAASRAAFQAENRAVKEHQKKVKDNAAPKVGSSKSAQQVHDSFQNFSAGLGIGTDNISTGSGYGFNPISRDRILVEWMYRGNWVARLAVDVVADDMTREGVEFKGEMDPQDVEQLEESATRLDIWGKINRTVKWGRLYGGGIAVNMVSGQDYSTAWDPGRTGKGQYKGLVVLDRWMVQPSLNELVTEEGPHIGHPKYYTVMASAPALRGKKIHYTRIIRMEGSDLPYQQRLTENFWTTSVYESVYDRMVMFDSASTGASQLAYKCYLRIVKIPRLRSIVAEGGTALSGLVSFVDMMRRFQGSEGVTLLDGEDEFEEHGANNYTGLAELLIHFGQQISGALQIPLVRLFGQSPVGLNSTGESDERLYYDGIHQQQVLHLQVAVTNIYRAIALSEGIKLPKGFGIKFKDLRRPTETEKSEIAERDARTITGALEGGWIDAPTAMRMAKKSGQLTGRFLEIPDQLIKEAEELAIAPTPEKVEVAEVKEGEDPKEGAAAASKTAKPAAGMGD